MGLFFSGLLLGIVLLMPEAAEWRAHLSGALAVVVGSAWIACGRRRPWLLPLGMMAGMGAAWWNLEQRVQPAWEVDGQWVRLAGVVADREGRERGNRLLLDEVRQVVGGNFQAQGMVRLSLHGNVLKAIPGDRVILLAKLKAPEGYYTPGGFDYQRYLLSRGIVATGYVKGEVRVVGHSGKWRWNRWRWRISQWIGNHLPGEARALAQALLVGKRGELSDELQNSFRDAGLSHLLAISGLHLGIAAGWSLVLLRFLLVFPLARRFDVRRPAALLALFPLLIYGGLAGFSISTQRASIMVGMFLLALALGRQQNPWRPLTLAAVLILLAEPYALFEAGFQLSFVAVASILLLLPWMGGGAVGRLAFASLAASLGTAAVAAHHFHQFTPWGLAANLLAVPLTSLLVVPLGMVTLLTWGLHQELAAGLLHLMGLSLDLLQWIAHFFAHLPASGLRLPGPPLPALAWFAALVALTAVARGWWRLPLGALALAMLFWPRSGVPDGVLRLAVLDVGQAQSVALWIPQEGWSIIDAGGYAGAAFNTGEAVISAFLWHHGATRLKRLIISHPQRDHMAGAARLLQNFPSERLWVAPHPGAVKKHPEYAALINTAQALGVEVSVLAAGWEETSAGARFRILSPPSGPPLRHDNDRSLVVEVTWGKHRFIIPGDLQKSGETWLLAQGPLPPVDVILMPHHGSTTSSSESFVQATRPRHAIASAGWKNAFRFPHPTVVSRWQAVGAQVWRTDQQGTVYVDSDGHTLTVTLPTPPARPVQEEERPNTPPPRR